jgi:hypothetical protein
VVAYLSGASSAPSISKGWNPLDLNISHDQSFFTLSFLEISWILLLDIKSAISTWYLPSLLPSSVFLSALSLGILGQSKDGLNSWW